MDRPDLSLLDLPDSLLLEIIAHLSVQDQLACSATCQRLHNVVHDDIQWSRKLREDKRVFNIRYDEELDSVLSKVGHFGDNIHTVVFDPQHCSLKLYHLYIPKEKRLKSPNPLEPEVATSLPKRILGALMGSIFRNNTPENPACLENAPIVTMFGPGLESVSTKGIARKILNSRSNQLCAMAMGVRNHLIQRNPVPKFGNHVNLTIGGGIIVKYYDNFLQFVTLYSNIRLRRVGISPQERLENSKLFELDAQGQFQATRGIQSVCEATAAFIYVIDISQDVTLETDLFFDLHAFAKHNVKAPVLVLACVQDAGTPHHNWPLVLEAIKLHSYAQPWQISLINVETLSNLDTALDWIVAHAAS